MTAVSPTLVTQLSERYDDRERGENFPVALRLLPATTRNHLRRIYAVARRIDDLGDRVDGDRIQQLQDFRADIAALYRGGTPREPCLRALAATVAQCGLRKESLEGLVDANLQDQQVREYSTFDDLIGYCRLSADPIGHMVLAVFGQADAGLEGLSDHICSALQVLEHCQDVAEDFRAGRIYLPMVDLRHAGCRNPDILAPDNAHILQAVVLLQVRRARRMMLAGEPLIGRLHGWAKIAVAGYLAGGMATADALEHARGDVVRSTPRPRHTDTLRHLVMLLVTHRSPRATKPIGARRPRGAR